MLFRVPTKPGPQPNYGVKLEFNSQVFDDDENGTDYHDRTVTLMMPQLGTTTLVEWGDRGMYCVPKPEIIKLITPVVPNARGRHGGPALPLTMPRRPGRKIP